MSEQKQEQEQRLEQRARQLFADSVAGLDGETRSRLTRARAAAVAQAARTRRGWLPAPLVPVGGVAAALLAVALFWGGPEVPVEPVESAALTDLDILLEGEELDLFEELEFYAWLLEQPELQQGGDQDDSG